nr:hypothetical protein [uncultured Oscillibacter sp.]
MEKFSHIGYRKTAALHKSEVAEIKKDISEKFLRFLQKKSAGGSPNDRRRRIPAGFAPLWRASQR